MKRKIFILTAGFLMLLPVIKAQNLADTINLSAVEIRDTLAKKAPFI